MIGRNNEKGFSLLEMVIVMFIMIILLSIALPTYQKTVQHARETVLQENLHVLRKVIQQYTVDKGKMPESLDNLKDEGYLREIPEDPITNSRETWRTEFDDDPNLTDGGRGIKDVKSGADGEDSTGKPYEEY